MALIACVLGCAPDPEVEDADALTLEATGCGEAACESGLKIALVSAVFTPGAYVIATASDGVEEVCSFHVGGVEDGCDIDGPCLLEDDCGVLPSFTLSPHSVSVQVGPDAPQVVDVVVLRGGTEIAAATFAPEYQTYAPAGPGCEPVCEIASAQLDLP